MLKMFEDIEGVEVVVDDVLIWGETEDQHDSRLVKVLEQARSQNLKLNRTKFQIKKNEITYLGHILSKNVTRSVKTNHVHAQKSPHFFNFAVS